MPALPTDIPAKFVTIITRERGAASIGAEKRNPMRFIEMTGKTLSSVLRDGEVSLDDLRAAGVREDTVVRINEQGDIEVRRPDHWDVVGGLLGDYGERIKRKTGMEWV